MQTQSEIIAGLTDRVADLDDAPDRARHEWFYADLARLAEDFCADATAVAYEDGYQAGIRDGAARRRTATVAATRTDSRPRHRTHRRDRSGRREIG
jgi:hypothetical protein